MRSATLYIPPRSDASLASTDPPPFAETFARLGGFDRRPLSGPPIERTVSQCLLWAIRTGDWRHDVTPDRRSPLRPLHSNRRRAPLARGRSVHRGDLPRLRCRIYVSTANPITAY